MFSKAFTPGEMVLFHQNEKYFKKDKTGGGGNQVASLPG